MILFTALIVCLVAALVFGGLFVIIKGGLTMITIIDIIICSLITAFIAKRIIRRIKK